MLKLFQSVVLFVCDGFQPFVGGVFAGDLEREVRKPTVGSCAVPVLHAGGNVDNRAGQNFLRRLALLLVPATARHADEHLTAAPRRAVDMPVVAAAGLEGYVGDGNLLPGNGREVTVASEILGVGRVGFADGEDHLALKGCLGILSGRIFRPYLFGEAECRPSLGPAGIKSDVGNDLGNFRAGDAVVLRRLQMIDQRGVGNTLTDERSNCHQAAVAKTKFVGAAPHLAEKNIVVKFGEFGGEVANWSRPAVCTILFCAITWSVKRVNTAMKTILFMVFY